MTAADLIGRSAQWARDAVDVVVVAAVVYRVLILMRGTRGAQVLIGLVVIVGGYLLSQTFALTALNYLMTHFVSNLFLILVVLFQNEIRRGLAQVGRGAVFGGPAYGEIQRAVEEIVRACGRMAQQRVGALLVLGRRLSLAQVIESGTALDARVSQALIETIFRPGTPLHDGAAVVEAARVVAAGCVLPLATEGELPREFGTRHRAALGLSQDSDAIVIIVSEERGVISLAREGRILFNLTPEELRSELQSLLRLPRRERGG